MASQTTPALGSPEDRLDLGPDRLNSLEEFGSLIITEVLDQDSRPTFVIDLDPDEGLTVGAGRILPIFCNTALRLHEKLLDVVLGREPEELPSDPEKPTYESFSSWATGVTKFDSSRDVFPQSFIYREMLWTGSTVRQRWRLISGNFMAAFNPPRERSATPSKPSISPEPTIEPRQTEAQGTLTRSVSMTDVSDNTAKTTVFSNTQAQSSESSRQPPNKNTSSSGSTGGSSQSARLTLATPEKAVADWTVSEPKGILSAHVAFARTVNWANTPLGPMEKWSPEFRQIANLVMGNPHPAAIFWGSDLTMFYNEAYANEVAGNKHPSLMGTGFSGPFSELWDSVSGIFAECARTGISIRKEDDYLPIERRGFVEETFYSWSWTPLYGGTTRILGFYNAPFETTQSVLNQRRMRTISQVGENVSRAKTIKQFWKYLIEGLLDNHFDVPFALLYSVGDGEENDSSSVSSGSTMSLKSCHFEGSIGIPDGHIAAPRQPDLKRSREGFIPAFREAMRTREPSLLHTRWHAPRGVARGYQLAGAIIFPVRPTNGDNVLAFLLIGVNPRRPYDDGYKAFTRMLNRQLATSLASFMLYEEEVKKSRDLAEAAALEQEQLTQQLALQTSRLRRMTELSPLGMYLVSPEGVLREANDRYFEMTGHPREEFYEMSWMEQIEDGSKQTMLDGWNRLILSQQPWTGELQLKPPPLHRPMDLEGKPIDYWVMVTAQPEYANDGSIRSVMGSITDISHLKWAQGLQARRLHEAEETRRQQNEFIDITSHEMRNPLSAILQCADDIISTLEGHRSFNNPPSLNDIEGCLDSAQTISLCVQHQKSIVDDILTVSKLDSNLLVISPIPSQPIEIVRRAVKMFDPELQVKDIRMICEVDPSFQHMSIDWVMLDPSRVLQILINLVTNAIKFTTGAPIRVITVSVSVSRDPPLRTDIPGFQYVPTKANNSAVHTEDWGAGEVVYLSFQVSDTGVGLTLEQMKVLFERFSQASPRTHAQYGGSGLGLFISRQLAELHGGQIGVSSQAASGSTFGFFVVARRAEGPQLGLQPSEHQLRLEREFADTAGLARPLAPHRQDLASPGPAAADLVASKALPTPTFDPKDLRILVVEDNLVNQNVLVKQLKKVGCSVGVANDGLEALAFLKETHFCKRGADRLSVILMDLEMPNMDGLTCVREIRKMQVARVIEAHVPVIAVTANVRDEQVTMAKRAGMDDVVSKPFQIPSLLKKIEALLLRESATSYFD
ncbi:hypothetical protein jhhlp_008517 [Lomentospora prolificans]|uniref:Histidine kinase n=1 Tax=Lomentospora prolificans TaxID=41688 RepID=A0A2N3MY98_9PEZI|nr:hypothetical protein jhhlp_008517 [Lomentospora prolificans]